VVDREELEVEGPELHQVALRHLDGLGADLVLLELGLDEGQGQLRADQRDVGPLAEQVGDATDVVLVAVRQHDRDDVVQAVPDGREVGEDDVDPGLVLLGEEDADVDDQQLSGVLEHGHVATDLAEATQGDHAQAAVGQRRGRAQFRVRATHALNVTARCRRSGDMGSPDRKSRTGATARCAVTPVPVDQMGRTFSAWGPFWPWVTSNSTCWPSSSDL
jgi:hypothetical protein